MEYKISLDRNFLNNVKIIMYQNTILLFVIVGFVAFYYFNKFNESEKEYIKLHGSVREIYNENQKLKLKVKELQAYKDDVSKTFKILDNELVMINDHIQRRQQPQQQPSLIPSLNQMNSQSNLNRVSLLTPELLNTVFFDIQPQRQNSTAIINTVVENIPIQQTEHITEHITENITENIGQEQDQAKLSEIQENVKIEESDKTLEEKLDEKALEEMLKNVEMSTMNDVRLMGEEGDYNNLLLDLNKFKMNNP